MRWPGSWRADCMRWASPPTRRPHPGDLVVPTLSLLAHRDHLAVHRVQARADQSLGMWALGESVPSLDRGFVRRDHTRGTLGLGDSELLRDVLRIKEMLTSF